MTRIVDTSVVVKWFVAEEGQNAAEALIGQPLLAPDLLIAEVANAAWKKWRQKEIGLEQAASVPAFARSFVQLVPAHPFADQAIAIALELDHPVYDCFFLALAESAGLPIVTADRRLLGRCKGTRFAEWLTEL